MEGTSAMSSPCRLGILTSDPDCYSSQRLVAAADAQGHEAVCIDTMHCAVVMKEGQAGLLYHGQALSALDAIIPRVGPRLTVHGGSVVRQFEALGVSCLNSSAAILRSRDKIAAHQVLMLANVPMPATAFVCVPHDAEALVDTLGPLPLVLKPRQSSQGQGVTLVETMASLTETIEAFRRQETDFLVQEFIAEASGEDIRCLVLEGEVIAAIKRRGAPGDFRSNLHQGGRAEAVTITDQERKLAILAAKTLDLGFAGVDLLRANKGPLVLEVNSSPGLEGAEQVTGADLAGRVVALAARHVASNNPVAA